MAADVEALRPGLDRSFSASVLERPSSSDQDPSAMTIDFLRARLLSERSVSKAERERAEQLAKKVSELEQRLEAEIQLRKSLESARLEVLSKYTGELDTDYVNGSDSLAVDGDSDRTTEDPTKEDLHAGATSSSRSGDLERWEQERAVDEEQSPAITLEDDEGSQVDTRDRVDSAGQCNFEEDGNGGSVNGDEETDQPQGKDKGVLAWGSRGVRRQQSMERQGRCFSPRSYDSTDTESPGKKWVGKSVRHKRKTENSVQETSSEEPAQIQDRDHVAEESTGQSEERTGPQRSAETDTEVERVLERQAEFIERFEAEEHAQTAWEEKFKQQNPSLGSRMDFRPQIQDQSSSSSRTERNNSKGGEGFGGVAVNSAKAEGSFETARSFMDETNLKHPPASLTTTALEEKNIVGNVTKKPTSVGLDAASVTSDKLQDDYYSSLARDVAVLMQKGSQQTQRETSEGVKSTRRGEQPRFWATSQEQIDSSDADIEAVEREWRGVGKLDRHLSSSFRFNGFLAPPNQNFNMLSENVTSTSPKLQDHSTARHEAIQAPAKESVRAASPFNAHTRVATASGQSSDDAQPRTVSREETPVGFRKPSAHRESREQVQEGKGLFWTAEVTNKDNFYDFNLQGSRTALNHHRSQMQQSVFPATPTLPRENAAMHAEAVADILEETTRRARTPSPWKVRNEYADTLSNPGFSNNPVWDSPWEDAFRRRMGTHDTTNRHNPTGPPRTLHGLSANQDLRMERSSENGFANNSNRVKLDNFPPLPGRRVAIRDDYVPHNYGLSRSGYQDTGFMSPRKSVDAGFDRLQGILEALQMAKQHVQSSEDQEIDLNSAHRNGYDNRVGIPGELGNYSRKPHYTKDYLVRHLRDNGSSSPQPSNNDPVFHRTEQRAHRMPYNSLNSNVYSHAARQLS